MQFSKRLHVRSHRLIHQFQLLLYLFNLALSLVEVELLQGKVRNSIIKEFVEVEIVVGEESE